MGGKILLKKMHIYKTGRKQIKIVVICAVFLLFTAVLAVWFYPANVTELNQKKTFVQVNDKIAVIEEFVSSENSPVITVQCHDNVHIVYFSDVISNKEWKETKWEIFDISGKFWAMDTVKPSPDSKTIRYNDRFLWLQAFNRRYVIIDLVNLDSFITPSYFQLTMIVLMTVSMIIMNITIMIYRKNSLKKHLTGQGQ